jgi:hypothetical protein
VGSLLYPGIPVPLSDSDDVHALFMKTEKTAPLTIEEVLVLASNYDFTSTKTLHIDQEIHRKFKSILLDYDEGNVTMKKLVNAILFQWIDDHKAELEGKLIEKVKKGY